MFRTLSSPASRLQNGSGFIRRGFSSSSTLMYGAPRRVISSLKPNELTSDDYCNLSGLTIIGINYGHDLAPLHGLDWDSFKGNRLPFPPKTHGFFYYYTPKNAPIFAGGMRFRICASKDPKTFQDGFDLLKMNGLPWEVTNWDFALKKNTELRVGEELVRTGVIHSNALDKCKELVSGANLTFSPTRPLVYAFRQPFAMMFGRNFTRVWIGDEEKMIAIKLYNDLISPFVRAETLDKRVKLPEVAHVCFDLEEDNVVLRLVSVPPRYTKKMEYAVGETRNIRHQGSQVKGREALAILCNSAFRNSWS